MARFGGDEFGIILTPIDSASSVALKTQRLAKNIQEPFHFEGQQLPISASYGGAVYPEDSHVLDELLDIADQAMYAQKRSFRGS